MTERVEIRIRVDQLENVERQIRDARLRDQEHNYDPMTVTCIDGKTGRTTLENQGLNLRNGQLAFT